MKLADNNTLRAIDNKGTAASDHGQLAHVNFLVLDVIFLAEAKLHVERDGIGDPFADRFDLGLARRGDVVADVFEVTATVVALDGKDFRKDRFQADGLALSRRLLYL